MRKKLVIGFCIIALAILFTQIHTTVEKPEISQITIKSKYTLNLKESIELINKEKIVEEIILQPKEDISKKEKEIKNVVIAKKKVIKINETYNVVELAPESGPVKKIDVKGIENPDDVSKLKLAEVNEEESIFVQVYSIDPTQVNFTEATVTAVAKGTVLYKCKDWNFTTQTCYGIWVKLMDITPGQEYSFTLTPEDPGFGENNGTFFEGFESGSLATNNWTTSGLGKVWYVGTTPYAGTYNIETENTNGESIVETNINTTDYITIVFLFYAKTKGLDPGEYLAADWYNGTDWINVLNAQTIASYIFYSYNLTNDANENSNLKVRFRCSTNSNNEFCYVDNVQVAGTQISGEEEETPGIIIEWIDPDKSEINRENNEITEVSSEEKKQISFIESIWNGILNIFG